MRAGRRQAFGGVQTKPQLVLSDTEQVTGVPPNPVRAFNLWILGHVRRPGRRRLDSLGVSPGRPTGAAENGRDLAGIAIGVDEGGPLDAISGIVHATGRANSPAVNQRGGEFAKLFPARHLAVLKPVSGESSDCSSFGAAAT